MTLLLEDIAKHITLNPEEQAYVLTLLETKNYKAKTFLLKEGETCNYLYFINKGVIRNYIIGNGNKEIVYRIADDGNWISSINSFHNQTAGYFNLEVLEDSEIVQLSHANYEKLLRESPKTERFFRLLAFHFLIESIERTTDDQKLTAEEKFLKFTSNYPGLSNRISQKHIASYIGVTPEFFSKMKARLLKK
jgi:CRP-like cAMP-binding protein